MVIRLADCLRWCAIALLLFTCVLPSLSSQFAQAQEAEDAQQKQIADRFLNVLLRRPRPGTALDRVYGYHIQAGSLDEFIDELESKADAGGDDAGAHQMLVGLFQLQRGSDAAAVTALQKAEPMLAMDAMVSYYLGKALLLVGKTNPAAEALERSIEREPARNDALMVYKELGRIYQRGEQNEKALSVWNRLEEAFPGDLRVGEEIATTLSQEGQLETALKRFQQLAKQSSSDDFRRVGYQVSAAELKRRLGKQEEAIKDLELILARLRPGSWLHSDVRRRIEAGFLGSGDYVALAEYYGEQVELNPDDVDTRLRHGRSLAKAGLLTDAIDALTKTAAKAPDNQEVKLALIAVYGAAGKPAEAAKQYEALAQLDPENPDYLVGWGNVLLEDKSVDKARRQTAAADVWQRLADARADDAVIVSQVADLMRKVDKTDEAIALYRKSIDLAPEQPQYREYLGEYLHGLDRKEEAMKVWQSLAEGDRKNRDSLIRLAEVLTLFKYPEKALEAFAEAETMDPTFAQRMRYSELLSRAEKYDDALAQLDKAAEIVETPEEREQVLRARIGVYSSSGTLVDRISEAQKVVAGDDADADAYRTLAMMLDAATRSTEAIEAAQKAVDLAPKDTAALSVAAELYRKSSRYSAAVDAYRTLAELDVRYLSNYLQRIAGLQMRMGQVDDALQTGKDLIAAQPGNPESYRFYSDLCFQSGRDDEGVETLRRALRSAPREASIRDALARVLADRFRTDEAIELYWSSLDAETDLDQQKRLISAVAPLYDRKGDFVRLVSRIQQRGRETSDARTTALLISEAQKATNDLGSARQTLEPLLAENPRDTELLMQMVSLATAADDLEPALDYQKQLTQLSDTPENRRTLLTLMVDAGQIEQAEASLQLMREADDPATMVSMIDRMIRRNDMEAAQRLCRTALQQRSDLWEIKTRLAGLLVMSEKYEEAVKLAQEVRALKLDFDVRAASKPLPKTRPTTGSSAHSTSVMPSSRMNRGGRVYYLASFFKLGRYANSYYGSRQFTALETTTYGQADYLALAIELAAAAKQGKLEELVAPMISEDVVRNSTDVDQLWQAYEIFNMRSYFSTDPAAMRNTTASQSGQPNLQTELYWRLAELDPTDGRNLLFNQLASRFRLRTLLRNPPKNAPSGAQVNLQEPEPLSDDRLDLISQMYEQQQQEQNTNQYYTAIDSWVYDELIAGGRQEQAEQIKASFVPDPETPKDTATALQFYVATRDTEAVKESLQHVKQNYAKWAADAKASDMSVLASIVGSAATELVPERRLDSLDMLLAIEAQKNLDAGRRRGRSSSQRTGQVHVYYNIAGSYRSKEIVAPFSSTLLSDDFVRSFYQQYQFGEDTPERDELLEHLGKDIQLLDPKSDAAGVESRLRATLHAFATWWIGDADGAYDAIVALTDKHPDENDLWIERARLAAELKRPRESLEALDAINPLDQATLRTRELAAMNLASQLGELGRAKLAARRLFGMRLDQNTELALSDQLSRMGLTDMATAVLQRTRRRGGQSTSALLEIGQRYLRAGDKAAAAEVAFAAMRKLNSTNDRNDSYYRGRAATMLKQAGRLDALVAQAERRAKSAPNSIRLQTELAELYAAAGRKEDANKVIEKINIKQPNDPRALLSTAKQLTTAGKPGKAVEHYLAAFKKDPSVIRNEYYNFENAVSTSKRFKYAYQEMMKWDFAQVDSYSIYRLTVMYRRRGGGTTPEALAFIDHVLKTAPPHSLTDLLRYSSRYKEIAQSKEMAAAMERILSDDSIYVPGNQFWQRYSRSSGGIANGPLAACVTAMGKNKETRQKIVAALKKRSENETQAAVAEPLLAAIQIDVVDPDQTTKTLKALMEKGDQNTPFPLWWQLGQILEKKEGLRDLAVDVLEYVQTYPQAAQVGSSYQYSIGAKLADTYVKAGQKQKARKQLMIGYENTDNSQDNRYNPGYGDYSDLRSYESIAKKLLEVDAPLDAIRIYADALSKPEKFEAAKRWGGSTNQKNFQVGLDKATKSLKPEHYREFFDQIAIEEKKDEEKEENEKTTKKTPDQLVDLLAMNATSDTKAENSSVMAMVVFELAKTDEGSEFLEQTSQRLSSIRERRPDDWSLVATQAMIAMALGDAGAAGLLADLNGSVKIPEEKTQKAKKASARLLSLYSPALMGLLSEDEQTVAAAIELATQLCSLAKANERPRLARVLTINRIRAAGTDEGSEEMNVAMQELLDATVAKSDPIKVLTTPVAKETLDIAELCQKVGCDEVAAEAVRRGFGGGPPLLVVQNQSSSRPGSSFIGITQSSSSSSEPVNTADLVVFGDRIRIIAANLNERPDGDVAVYEMLREIVFPAARAGEVFPYAKPVVGPNHTWPYAAKNKLKVESLSSLLVESAVEAGRGDQLGKLIKQREANVSNKLPLRLVQVQLALNQKDLEGAISILNQMATSLGISLDAKDTADGNKNQQAQKLPGDVITVANLMLHASLPIAEIDKQNPTAIAIHKTLLDWSGTDRNLASHDRLWKKFTDELIRNRGNSNDRRSLIDAFLGSVRQRYSNYAGNYADERASAERTKLGKTMLEVKDWSLAGAMLRETAFASQGIKLHDRAQELIPVAMQMSDAPPEQQYDLLSKIMFGEKGDGQLKDWTGFVLYAQPPPELREITPQLKVVRSLPLSRPDFPILSTSLMISKAAAEIGKSDELIKKLQTHVKQPGDHADAMIGLVKFDAGDEAGAVEILQRATKVLGETIPPKNGDAEFNIPAGFLAAKLLKSQQHRPLAIEALTHLLQHVRRSKYSYVRTFYGRVLAKNGGSAAAGAKQGMPLKHFVASQIPYRGRPESPNTEPCFVVRDGSLRYAGGADQNSVMLRYPLEGDFTFKYRNKRHGWSDSSLSYGGVAYIAASWSDSLSAVGLVTRGSGKFNCDSFNKNKANILSLRFEGDKLHVGVNDKEVVADKRTSAMPFVAAHTKAMSICDMADFVIEGDPVIPREVNMIDDRLRGWSCQIFGGSLPNLDLPIAPDEEPENAKTSRQSTPEQEATRRTWYADNGMLKTGKRGPYSSAAGMGHIQYLRPLCEGESITYEFRYEPEKAEVHPTLGRTAILLRPDGIKLRWLIHNGSMESAGVEPLNEAEPTDWLDGKDKYALKKNDWNQVKLTADDQGVIVEVNGEQVCRVHVEANQKFGVLHEEARTCELRKLTLTGPWPEKLPENLMAVGGS